MWTQPDIAWLAGLYEGEGCVSTHGRDTFHISIGMTDRDVIERAQRIAGLGRIYYNRPQQAHHKPQWRWTLGEHETYALLVAMLPWLGVRRRAKAIEAIKRYATRPRRKFLTAEERRAVIDDYLQTGDSQWTLAGRHGISRSRVQQLLSNEGTRA